MESSYKIMSSQNTFNCYADSFLHDDIARMSTALYDNNNNKIEINLNLRVVWWVRMPGFEYLPRICVKNLVEIRSLILRSEDIVFLNLNYYDRWRCYANMIGAKCLSLSTSNTFVYEHKYCKKDTLRVHLV